MSDPDRIETIEELEAIYGFPKGGAVSKEIDYISDHYQSFIEASPFVLLSTVAEEGTDCSPRGDPPGFVRVADKKTVMMPDRNGNNRVDSLRNIVRDGRVSLMFMVAGSTTVVRVNGLARLTADADLTSRFEVKGQQPRSVIVIKIAEVYTQCARALLRSELWAAGDQSNGLPTPGEILTEMTSGDFDGAAYDVEWPQRAAKTMW